MPVATGGLAAFALREALRPFSQKRGPGRPRSRFSYSTLLTGSQIGIGFAAAARRKGRPKGAKIYTEDNLRWLAAQVDSRKRKARGTTGTEISDRAALRIDMTDHYRNVKGYPESKVRAALKMVLPRLQKALSRYRAAETAKGITPE